MTKKTKFYDTQDIITKLFLSGQISWEDIIADARRDDPGSFVTEEDEWCHQCGSYRCHCYEDQLAAEAWDREIELDNLYDEALEEDAEREETKRRAEEQAQIDAEITAEEEVEREEQEFWDSFSHFWYKLVGWKHYNRFVAPILIRIHRFKQDWCR